MGTVWVECEEAVHGDLPPICMRCGEEATVTRTKTMTWYPGWVNLLFIFNFLIWAIVAAVLMKRMELKAPFCERHKGHWFYFSFFLFSGLGILLASFLIGGVLVSEDDNTSQDYGAYVLIVAGFSLLFFVAIVAIWHITLIRPLKMTPEGMKLRGVSEEFHLAYPFTP